MALFDKNYIWRSQILKEKYKKYSNIYVLLLIVGAIFVLGLLKYVTQNPTIIGYASYIGWVLWVGAVVTAVLQSKIKTADKQIIIKK